MRECICRLKKISWSWKPNRDICSISGQLLWSIIEDLAVSQLGIFQLVLQCEVAPYIGMHYNYSLVKSYIEIIGVFKMNPLMDSGYYSGQPIYHVIRLQFNMIGRKHLWFRCKVVSACIIIIIVVCYCCAEALSVVIATLLYCPWGWARINNSCLCHVKQRLLGELPLSADELEKVFVTLDSDSNGFLTLDEFSTGFSMSTCIFGMEDNMMKNVSCCVSQLFSRWFFVWQEYFFKGQHGREIPLCKASRGPLSQPMGRELGNFRGWRGEAFFHADGEPRGQQRLWRVSIVWVSNMVNFK